MVYFARLLQRLYSVLVLILLAACRRPAVSSSDPGAAPSVTSKPVAVHPMGIPPVHDVLQRVRLPSEQAALEAALANLKARSGPCPFELVAVAPKTHLRLWVGGSRLLAWGKGFQASADGDAPLLPDDFLKGLAYDADKQSLLIAGAWPNLLALRVNDALCATKEFSISAFGRRGGRWEALDLPNRGSSEGSPPYGFVSWKEGGLLVDSATNNCGAYTSGGPLGELARDERGTAFMSLSSNGTVTRSTIGVERTFVAWGASSAGDTLAIVGSYAPHPGANGDSTVPAAVVMRRHGKRPFRMSAVGPKTETPYVSTLQRLREFGKAALFLPPPARDDGTPPFGYPEVGDEVNWKDHAKSLFIVGDSETMALTWRTPVEQDCFLADAALDSDGVLAIMECPRLPSSLTGEGESYVSRLRRLIRIRADGSKELFELPKLQRQPELTCEPERIELRSPDDLWVSATCGSDDALVAALFRRGHPQAPLYR